MFQLKPKSSSDSKTYFQHTKFKTYLPLKEIVCYNERHLMENAESLCIQIIFYG